MKTPQKSRHRRFVIRSFVKGFAATNNRNLKSDGQMLWSYATPIAIRYRDTKTGKHFIVLCMEKYSQTTTVQQGVVSCEARVACVPCVTSPTEKDFRDFMDLLRDAGRRTLLYASGFSRSAYDRYNAQEAANKALDKERRAVAAKFKRDEAKAERERQKHNFMGYVESLEGAVA